MVNGEVEVFINDDSELRKSTSFYVVCPPMKAKKIRKAQK
jgi:hypothetical protein